MSPVAVSHRFQRSISLSPNTRRCWCIFLLLLVALVDAAFTTSCSSLSSITNHCRSLFYHVVVSHGYAVACRCITLLSLLIIPLHWQLLLLIAVGQCGSCCQLLVAAASSRCISSLVAAASDIFVHRFFFVFVFIRLYINHFRIYLVFVFLNNHYRFYFVFVFKPSLSFSFRSRYLKFNRHFYFIFVVWNQSLSSSFLSFFS